MYVKLQLLLFTLIFGHVYGKIGYFWQITDIHYDAPWRTNGNYKNPCRREYADSPGAVRWPASYETNENHHFDYNCDTSWALIESTSKAMRSQLSDSIEFVLWTGDALSKSSMKLPFEERMILLRNVTDFISRTFSSQFVFPVVGQDEGVDIGHLADLWRRWLPPEAMQTFQKGGYYTIEQKERKLRICVLNTNLWTEPPSPQNDRERKRAEDAGQKQWDWLEQVLIKSHKNRETIYLVGHIAPGSDERQGGALPLPHAGYTFHNNMKYVQMVRRFSSIIVGQFFGHLHSDTFRIVYNKNGKPISWMMLAPSLTPRGTNGAANNPGLRLYKFDTDSGEVLDYNQYYLDLSRLNGNNDISDSWVSEYNFTNYYGIKHISAASLHHLVDKFTKAVPDKNVIFSRYYTANAVGMYAQPSEGGCDMGCAHVHYCACTCVDYNDYKECMKMSSALASTSTRVNFNHMTMLLIFFYVLFILRSR